MDVKKNIVIRLVLIYLTASTIALVIIGQIIYLQVWGVKTYGPIAKDVELKPIKTTPDRGNICAENGEVLATSLPYFEIRIDFFTAAKYVDSIDYKLGSLADSLSKCFKDKTKSQYRTELLNAFDHKDRFYQLKQEVSYEEYQRLRTFPVFKKGRYKGGFIAIKYSKRILPYKNLAARTIGSLQNGKYIGIEGSFNSELTGDVRERMYRKIGPNWIPEDEEYYLTPSSGKDVITTLDVNYQDYSYNALLQQMLELNADTGTVILMEVKTGKIKAMVNLTRIGDGRYLEDYNYAVGMRYEPGSTFKLASFIAAMEDGYIDLKDSVQTGNGTLNFKDFTISESGHYGYGKITVKQVFEKSSNVGTALLIYNNYKSHPEKFIDRLHSMGLNDKTEIEISGEAVPLMNHPGNKKGWSGVSLPQMAIGYEVMLTPLQILNFYNAVANNGVMVKPRIIDAIRERGEITKKYHTQITNSSICSKATLERAKIILKGVVKNGTAKNIDGAPYEIAGKTGTAQVARGKSGYKKGEYTENIHFGSFVGYFPADNPVYSCIVVIKTRDPHFFYGNLVAAPVFRKIADKVYATSLLMQKDLYTDSLSPGLKRVPDSKNGYLKDLDLVFKELRIPVKGRDKIESKWVLTNESDAYVQYQNRIVRKDKVPMVLGMGLKDAVFLLESAGLHVIIEGRGTVLEQSIEAGMPVQKNQSIKIILG
jgi:cell division protein FtsI (penicillin-binding protein 3)